MTLDIARGDLHATALKTARGLSEAQREAILNGKCAVPESAEEWSSDCICAADQAEGLCCPDLGLAVPRGRFPGGIVLTALGLEVRALLKDNPMETVELKACPFCGGPASDTGKITYGRPLDDATWADGSPILIAYYVNCMRCGAVSRSGISGGYQTKAEAITAWNARFEASLPPSAPDRDAVDWQAMFATPHIDPTGMHGLAVRLAIAIKENCAIGAGTAEIDRETGMLSVAADLDLNGIAERVLAGLSIIEPTAALALPPSGIAEAWQDISTAPKDGTRFVAATADGALDFARWHRDHVCGDNDGIAPFVVWHQLGALDLSNMGDGE